MTGSATCFGGSPGPVLIFPGAGVSSLKPFMTYTQQVALLASRGMAVEDPAQASEYLARLNYYRLSGYWHTMRNIDSATGRSMDTFQPGASFDTVVSLYEFDERLRNAVFSQLASVEVAMRAMLGYELGKIDPLIHVDAHQLGAPAHQPSRKGSTVTAYQWWLDRFTASVNSSKEDFVAHHKKTYGARMPIWVAVEVMDWGLLSHLYRMAPGPARYGVATRCGLKAPQLESWLRALNVLRNLSAHQARLFNRSFDITPRLNNDPRLQPVKNRTNRVFGQLTLIQYLHRTLGLSPANQLPAVIDSYPHNALVPFSRIGAPQNWQTLDLWQPQP